MTIELQFNYLANRNSANRILGGELVRHVLSSIAGLHPLNKGQTDPPLLGSRAQFSAFRDPEKWNFIGAINAAAALTRCKFFQESNDVFSPIREMEYPLNSYCQTIALVSFWKSGADPKAVIENYGQCRGLPLESVREFAPDLADLLSSAK